MTDDHDTRRTLLTIKEILVDPLTSRIDRLDDASKKRHDQVLEKLSDLDARSFSEDTATRLRALTIRQYSATGDDPPARRGDASGKRHIVHAALQNPAAPWILAMALMIVGILVVVVILTGHTVTGVIGSPLKGP